MKMKILIAVDGSTDGDAAIDGIGRRTWPEGTEIRLIHVFTPCRNERSEATCAMADHDLNKQSHAAGVQFLREAQAKLDRLAPGAVVDTVLREGSVKDAILHEAESWGACMIALGSTGDDAFDRVLLGATFVSIAIEARCWVEVFTPPLPQNP